MKEKTTTIQQCGLGSSGLNKEKLDKILAALAGTDFPIKKRELQIQCRQLDVPNQRSIKKMAYACLAKMESELDSEIINSKNNRELSECVQLWFDVFCDI